MSGRRGKSDWPSLREWYYGMPGPVRRLLWWWVLPFAWMGAMIVVISVRLAAPALIPGWVRWIDPWGMFVGQFIAMGVTIYKTRRLKRDFVASDGRLCTECAHSLKGLANEGKCPECGSPYDVMKDRATWKRSEMGVPRATERAPAESDSDVQR